MFTSSTERWDDSQAPTISAEVERNALVAPDVLLGHVVGLGFNLNFVRVVVAPGDTVTAAERALAVVDLRGDMRDCDGYGAAMACCADWCRRGHDGM